MTRVAITTDRFDSVASEYLCVGLEPVPVPCVDVVVDAEGVLSRAREAASHADLMLITSPRTVELLWPEGGMPPTGVVTVGATSAAAVETAGGRVVVTGRSGLAGLLAGAADVLSAARVVFPHAAGTDPGLVACLRSLVSDLEEQEIYRAVPVAPDSTPVHAVVFASPSAVTGWLLARDFDGVVVGVIGPTTRTAVARHRMPEVIAPEPSHHSLARALRSYMEVSV
ncbi:MAG TPA: uroporphyrinogen-III synthase [Acidimicrobiia bacterium]|nr:uroporphyrinogen-III synthase [Acidimicrobiia bacterium]